MNRVRQFPCCGVLFAALLLVGCGGNSTSKYIPASTTAREALTTALTAWQSGTAYGPLEQANPKINVFDARWQAGKELQTFEILEEVPGQEHPEFKVRMQLQGQPEEVLTYRVVGLDPLLIFRDADYQRATGM